MSRPDNHPRRPEEDSLAAAELRTCATWKCLTCTEGKARWFKKWGREYWEVVLSESARHRASDDLRLRKERKKLRPHDLQRTFRTMLSRIEVAPHVAELCLGHIEKETMRRVYDGHDYSSEMADA